MPCSDTSRPHERQCGGGGPPRPAWLHGCVECGDQIGRPVVLERGRIAVRGGECEPAVAERQADGRAASAAVGSQPPLGGARFDVQLTQALPFLSFAGADVEMLMAVRSMFREELLDTSVYDEVLAIRPPKRIVGGVTVRF